MRLPVPVPVRRRRAARRHQPAVPRTATWYGLAVVVAFLVVIGLVMVLSASSVQSERESGSTWSYFIRQSMWTSIGIGGLLVTSRIDYRRLPRFIPLMMVASVGLLLVVLVPGVGVKVNGARSWLGAGPFRMQPAELVKLTLVLFCADLLARRDAHLDDARMTLRPILVVGGITGVLMMMQPDLGSTMVMGAIVFAVLFVGGLPVGRLAGWFTLATGASVLLALSEPYRRARLLAFLDPSADPGNTGYQINQSLMGIASGGLLGLGLGQSRAKWGFLPNAHTDFIFAIVAEELGLLGAMVVVALFVALAFLGTKAALDAPDRFGRLLAAGITAWIVAQALVNIGGVVGLLPITGLTLPYVSFGGSSLVVTLAATGVLLNIAGAGRRPRRRAVPETHPSRRPALASR